MNNRIQDIPEELLDILEELVVYEDTILEDESQSYLELEYLEYEIEDCHIEPEERGIIHIQL